MPPPEAPATPDAAPDTAPAEALPRAALDNIDTILRLQEEAWRRRSLGERLADGVAVLVGRGAFVACHVLVFALWAAFNTSLVRGLPVFDPYPFDLFGNLLSLEALAVTAFVLIKQNRLGTIADRRAHLELQMILLTEREVSKLIRIMERVTAHLGIPDALDEEAHEMGAETVVGDMVRTLRDRLPE